MSYTVLVLVAFISLSFGWSAFEKLWDWSAYLSGLETHFNERFSRRFLNGSLVGVFVLEVFSVLVLGYGTFEYVSHLVKETLIWGTFFSLSCLFVLLIGQRLAKDYDGARTVILYFIPTLFLLFLLE